MKRIALIMLVMLSVQSISAQRYERPSIHYSKEETYEYLKDYCMDVELQVANEGEPFTVL